MEILGNYLVDIVFCFGGSMRSNGMLLRFQNIAKDFPADFNKKMQSLGKNTLITRAKVFSVKNENDQTIFLKSPFYDLEKRWGAINTLIDEIKVSSSVHESKPIDELWLIAKALLSEWNEVKDVNKKRQIILYFKDNTSNEHNLETENIRLLLEYACKFWDDSQVIDQIAKRMLLFAPDTIFFSKILDELENTIHYPLELGLPMTQDN